MTDCLSIPEILRWLDSKFSRHVESPYLRRGGELPANAFCRAVGIDKAVLSRFRSGAQPISAHTQRMISRFIREWENGMIEFGTGGTGKGHSRRVLVRRERPAPRPPRFTVEMYGRPRLRILPRPAPTIGLPRFARTG